MAARKEEAKRAGSQEDAGEKEQESQDSEKGRKRGSLAAKMPLPDSLVRISIGIIILGGMTIGVFFLITDVIGPNLGPVEPTDISGTTLDEDVPPVAQLPGDQHMVEDIIINPAGTRGKRFLRLGIALETQDGAKVLQELETRRAQVRDLLIRKFSSRTLDEVGDPIVREELRLSCIEGINAMLVSGEISTLYFTDYVLQ